MYINFLARYSQNNNTPQPLDRWMNSPFIDQQVGNYNSFTLPDYQAIYLPCTVAQGQYHCHIQFTPRLFQMSRPSHARDIAISIFYFENPRSRSCLMWTLKVTTWVQHSIDSHRFHSMSMGSPIPDIQHLQNLTLEIQFQGHGWGERWKLQQGSDILSTHTPFVPCRSAIPFLIYDFFFKIWPWKSEVKVMGQVNVESHKMGPTFYRLTFISFNVNQPSHSWITASSKFDLEYPRSRSWLRSKLKVTKWVQQHFQNLTLKIQGQFKMTIMLHNYGFRQFHRI